MGDVGVLVLVHQHVAEAALIIGEHVGMVAEEADRFDEKVAEIDRVQNLEPVLIGGIERLTAAAGEAAAFGTPPPCPG